MNITIFSLSLSSIYSHSPIFVGNNINIRNSYASSSIPIFFFNPESFKIDHCYFNRLGQVLIKKDDITPYFSYKNIPLFLEDNLKPIVIANESFDEPIRRDSTPALVIHDCIFKNIKTIQYCIQIYGRRPFYMTRCNFVNCSTDEVTCKIETHATTITHICMINCYSKSNYNYFHFDFDAKSFLKLVFSTFVSEYSTNDYEYSGCQGGIYFQSGNIQVKCSNLSQINSGNHAITINTPSYFLFLMNTVCASYQCKYIFNAIVGFRSYDYNYNETKQYFLFSLSNIYNNSYIEGLFSFSTPGDFEATMSLVFSNCSFWKNHFDNYYEEIDYYNIFEVSENSIFKFYFDQCNFDIQPKNTINFEFIDCNTAGNINSVIETFKNDHYVNLFCPGTEAINAYGCAEDNCLDIEECELHFSFAYGEVTYTLIFQPDINTPTPSKSQMFSYSRFFSNSEVFSFSNFFSDSNRFSNSDKFSKSEFFSDSKQFTKSNFFSESGKFTKSKYFSESGKFTKSNFFSESGKFTKSQYFDRSWLFTKSMIFSDSNAFSSSSYFIQTSFFSYSEKFTKSNLNNVSTINRFSSSNSDLFSLSELFTESNYFSRSIEFTETKTFSLSKEFTESHLFSNSKELSASTTFSNLATTSTIVDFGPTAKISLSLSLMESYVVKKSVSFSISEIPSILYTNILMSNGEYTFGFTQVYVPKYYPYIIRYFSPTIVSVEIITEFNVEKKKISQEQLIGIVCGAAAGFFGILGIIVLSVRRVNRSHFQYDDDDDYLYTSDNAEIIITTENASGNI